MPSGEYITNRLMPQMIRQICQDEGIELTSFSDDWLLRLSRGDRRFDVLGYRLGANSTVAGLIAQDKVATYAVLQSAGVASLPHYLLKSTATQPPDLAVAKPLFADGGRAVLKPLDGSGGRGVVRLDSLDHLADNIDYEFGVGWAISPLTGIKAEQRLLLLDGEILLSYDKQNPQIIDGLKMFNLGLGATPVVIETDLEPAALAKRALAEVGLRLAAVDVITTDDDERLVLEINDGFMMEHFARHSDEYYQLAQSAYRQIINRLLATQ